LLKVINVISDSNIGGAGTQLLTFLRGYDRGAMSVTVALPRGSQLINRLKEAGTEYTELDGLADRSLSGGGIISLAKFLRAEQPNIVHTHASMSARIAARAVPRARIVYTRHSVFPNKRAVTVFPGKQLYGAVNNFFAHKIIAVSPAARDNIIEAGVNPKKIEVIFNGVEAVNRLTPEEKRETRGANGLPEDAFLCGTFARLTPVKGHEYILDAAKLLHNNKGIKIVIAGAGELEAALKERAAKEGLDNVIFKGFVQDAPRVIASMDLLLNASYGTEATSLFLLEGMSAGVPAVVSCYGGNPYVIKDGSNGLVTPVRDGNAIAEAVTRIAGDPVMYRKLSKHAVETYNERFTAELMVKNIERLYFSMFK
jgi:glycosyltransferase involved in cell wall biosynthesis